MDGRSARFALPGRGAVHPVCSVANPVGGDAALVDSEARTDWVAEGGEWWCRGFGSMATFESVGFVEEPSDEADRENAIVSIAWNIAYNLWPTSGQTRGRCAPPHGDHPLEPGLWRCKAASVCLHDKGVGLPIGSLDRTCRRESR